MVYFKEIDSHEAGINQENPALDVAGGRGSQSNCELLLALMAQNANLQNCVVKLWVQREDNCALLQQQHQVIATSKQHIGQQLHQLLGNSITAPNQVPNQQAPPAINASLSPTPQSLYILWNEWEIGIGGRKAAKFFTPQEHGIVKH